MNRAVIHTKSRNLETGSHTSLYWSWVCTDSHWVHFGLFAFWLLFIVKKKLIKDRQIKFFYSKNLKCT